MSHILTELFKAIYIISLFISMWGAVRLSQLKTIGRHLKLTLSFFLLLMTVPSIYLYSQLTFPEIASTLLHFQIMMIWIYGPCLLLVIHTLLHLSMQRHRVLLYFAPAIAAMLYTVVIRTTQRSLPAWWELLCLGQAMIFALASLFWILKRRRQIQILTSEFPASSFHGLLYLSAGLLCLLGVDFFIHYHQRYEHALAPLHFYALVTPSALYAIGTAALLVWRNTHPADDESVMSNLDRDTVAAKEPVTFHEDRKLELSENAAQQLTQELNRLIQTDRLHTRNDLSLTEMAAALKLSTHLTSELLNCHLKTSFYDFLNLHRITEAATLLQDADVKRSIADVAYEAGFNNINSFYREFKRFYNTTPAQFRRIHLTHKPEAADQAPLMITPIS